MKFEDRISEYPGRIKLTDENGEAHYYTLERADEPTQPGTPLSAENLNKLTQDVNGKTGASIVLTGDDIAISASDNTTVKERFGETMKKSSYDPDEDGIVTKAKMAINAINDENGNNIFETYATKEALNKKSDLKILEFRQLDKAANLKFSGEVNTRRLAALLYVFGQSGPIEPVTIGFGGIDGTVSAQNLDTVISSNTHGITAGSTGTVHIPQAINYGYGNYTILLIQSNLNVEIEYVN